MKKFLIVSLFLLGFFFPSFVYAHEPVYIFYNVCENYQNVECNYPTLEEALDDLDVVLETEIDHYERAVFYIYSNEEQVIDSHDIDVTLSFAFMLSSGSLKSSDGSVLTMRNYSVISGQNVTVSSLNIHSYFVDGISALFFNSKKGEIHHLNLINKGSTDCGSKLTGLILETDNVRIDSSVISGFDIATHVEVSRNDLCLSNNNDERCDVIPIMETPEFSGSYHPSLYDELVIDHCDFSNNNVSLVSYINTSITNSKLSSIISVGPGYLNLFENNDYHDLKVTPYSEDSNYCVQPIISRVYDNSSFLMTKDMVVDLNKTKKIQNMLDYFKEDASDSIDFDYEVFYGEDSDVTKEYVKVTDGSISILQPGMVTIKASRNLDPSGATKEVYVLNLKIEKTIINPGTGTILLIGFVVVLIVSLVMITILTKRKKK